MDDEAKIQEAPAVHEEEVQNFNTEVELLAQHPNAVRIDTEGDFAERCESFLVNLLLNFDPAYAVELHRTDQDEIAVEIFGGDPGKIIGRGGRTLSALEYVANAVLNRGDQQDVRVNIDVGGYKRRRDERLRNAARKAAGRVRDTVRQDLQPGHLARVWVRGHPRPGLLPAGRAGQLRGEPTGGAEGSQVDPAGGEWFILTR